MPFPMLHMGGGKEEELSSTWASVERLFSDFIYCHSYLLVFNQADCNVPLL